jgi:hypothetical protein
MAWVWPTGEGGSCGCHRPTSVCSIAAIVSGPPTNLQPQPSTRHTGQERLRITAASNPKGEPECIWSLAVLGDGLVVSGSSRGVVQVWDPEFGTLFSRAHLHKGDVTCVTALPDGSAIFAGGVDPTIVQLSRGTLGAPDAPEKASLCGFRISDKRRHHSADLRALALVSVPRSGGPVNFLVSGANDADLLVHFADAFGRQHPVRVCTAPCAPTIAVGGGRLVSASGTEVHAWIAAAVAPVAEVRTAWLCARCPRCCA